MPTITLETKCWESDWQRLLESDRLWLLAERNRVLFAERTLMINNVTNLHRVRRAADRLIRDGVLTGYVIVADHADEALRFFDITRESLTRGYVYSIAELVSIYLCRTDYLLHFAGDCIPLMAYSWIPEALALFDADNRIKVANLTWDAKYEEAAAESTSEVEEFYLGFGFSDQSYLVRTADFKAPIYNETHEASARYPDYGGELFEKRVDSWMRNHGYLRATFKHGTYIHEAWSRQPARTFRSTLRSVVRRLINR